MELTREAIRTACENDHAATVVTLAPLWLRDHPGDVGVLLDYAEMLYQMTRYDEAVRVYQEMLPLISTEKRRWSVYTLLGKLHRYWGRHADAEEWFRRAVAANPDEVACHVMLGACQARQGKLREAEETHRRGAALVGASLRDEAIHNLGLVLRGQGRLAEAADCFRQAIELDPEYDEAVEALADVAFALTFVPDAPVTVSSAPSG